MASVGNSETVYFSSHFQRSGIRKKKEDKFMNKLSDRLETSFLIKLFCMI